MSGASNISSSCSISAMVCSASIPSNIQHERGNRQTEIHTNLRKVETNVHNTRAVIRVLPIRASNAAFLRVSRSMNVVSGVLILLPVIVGAYAKWNAYVRRRTATRQAKEFQSMIRTVERFKSSAGDPQTRTSRRDYLFFRESRPVVAYLDLQLVGLTFNFDSNFAAVR